MKKYNQYGNKRRQTNDREDKSIDYKNLIYSEDSLYSSDRDLIVYKYHNNEPKIVAFLELTRIEKYPDEIPPIGYFNAILNRFRKDSQKKIGDLISKLCFAPTIIVAMSLNLERFYLYNLTKDNGVWHFQNTIDHIKWHYKIRGMSYPHNLQEKYENKKTLEVIYSNG